MKFVFDVYRKSQILEMGYSRRMIISSCSMEMYLHKYCVIMLSLSL